MITGAAWCSGVWQPGGRCCCMWLCGCTACGKCPICNGSTTTVFTRGSRNRAMKKYQRRQISRHLITHECCINSRWGFFVLTLKWMQQERAGRSWLRATGTERGRQRMSVGTRLLTAEYHHSWWSVLLCTYCHANLSQNKLCEVLSHLLILFSLEFHQWIGLLSGFLKPHAKLFLIVMGALI